MEYASSTVTSLVFPFCAVLYLCLVNSAGLTVDPLLITCRRVVCGLIHKEFISPIKDLWIPESLKE